MVKPPKIRHSKPRRDPVTIDLEARDVTARGETASPAPADGAPSSTVADSSPQPGIFEEAVGASEAAPVPEPDTAIPAQVDKATPAKADDKPSQDKAGPAFGRSGGTVPPSGTTKPSAGDAGKTDAKPAARPAEPPRQASQSSSPQPAPKGGSPWVAGIVGGLVVLLLGGVAQFAGLIPGSGANATDETVIAGLRQEIAALSARIPEANGTGAELRTALDGLRAEVEALKSAAPAGDGADAAAALEPRLKGIDDALAALRTAGEASTTALQGVESRLAAAETAAKEAASAAAAAGERIGTIESRVGTLGQEVAAQASNPKIALAIAAAGLKAAIDRGMPFMTELETYAAVSPDAPEIETLRSLAASGVPTRADIAARAPDAAIRMIQAATPVDQNAGLIDRLLSSLESVVKVRPVGEVDGAGVGPTTARIEAAVRSGDYAKAIAEYDTLPEPAKAAGASFIADVKARRSADELVERALAGALRS